MKTYDNYDYEKAYSKQLHVLEEWEIEQEVKRLLSQDKVSCIYRTTTNKARNIKSGKELLEVQIYPSFKHREDVPNTRLKKETKASQRNLNDKNAKRYLIRLANINFGYGDIWATFGWNNDNLPEDRIRAKKDITNFINRIKRRRKKLGREETKYIYVLAFDGYARPHFHLLISGDGMDRDELEDLWKKGERKNTRRIRPDDKFLLTGLATYISQNPHGTKRWVSSKNLVHPKPPSRSYSKFRSKRKIAEMAINYHVLEEQMEKAYPGYRFLDRELYSNDKNGTFYLYVRMIRD